MESDRIVGIPDISDRTGWQVRYSIQIVLTFTNSRIPYSESSRP